MPKIINPFSVRSDYEVCNNSLIHKLTFFSFIIFVISLPFTGIEWDLFSIDRLEIKITMITFPLLFISWLVGNLNFSRRRNSKEILFYFFAFIYGVSQFISIINSPFPLESAKQGIIIVSLLMMMIVISETILNKKSAEYILITIGTLSLLIGSVATLNYYFFDGYVGRLGLSGSYVIGIINLGGDPPYFGDILLYSIGSVFFVALRFRTRKYLKWVIGGFLLLWMSAIVLTFTKGVIVAVICFFLLSIFLLKGKRHTMLLIMISFIIIVPINFHLSELAASRFKSPSESEPYVSTGWSRSRLNVLSKHASYPSPGAYSISIRLKAIKVSYIQSLDNKWFGHGAGSSQKLLPQMANQYDKNIDAEGRLKLELAAVYGEAVNTSIIDSHVLFLTELFNVGMLGAVSLMCLIAFVMREQLKAIKSFKFEIVDLNKLQFATLISMLIYRMSASFVVIPFLFFILGLNFGICKVYWNHQIEKAA